MQTGMLHADVDLLYIPDMLRTAHSRYIVQMIWNED